MTTKKIIAKFTDAEIADSFVISEKITAKQKKAADLQLGDARKKQQSLMTEKERLLLRLLQLKFHIEDHLSSKDFNPKYTFGYFLSAYVSLLNRKRKHFAQEIDIAETELSQLINRHRAPSEYIFIRLEIHSNNSIPAVVWYKLIEKEKEYSLMTNKALRQQEKKYVTNKIQVSIG